MKLDFTPVLTYLIERFSTESSRITVGDLSLRFHNHGRNAHDGWFATISRPDDTPGRYHEWSVELVIYKRESQFDHYIRAISQHGAFIRDMVLIKMLMA